MKMHMMDGGGWREEGRIEDPGRGLLRNSEVSVSTVILLTRERAP